MPSDAEQAAHAKRALRAELRERRRIRPRHEREVAEEELTRQLIALVSELGPRRLSCYLSTPDEPPTRGFLDWAREQGIEVLLPVSRDDGLLDWAPLPASGADALAELVDAAGLPVPDAELLSPLAINDAGLILVPAAAVDRSGMRMGWGRGYFDKTLGSMERRPPVFAVVFDDELVDELPSEPHDERVDGIVTPSGTTRF
ncbi:5-formyltetrahydrofolate cyclo-ligase [Microcella alkalica]|uniref:5-formyltetrahydrofolate cyclo-ligase n=1 Tax=Microcella alkalica TaxID=355930 RepID=A0A839ECN4_9MICO|nr:5-formyltetrahydrofolate cyclo-ligase [Microcella alkalica]MBA8848004.1 5-formyltetrahydrofolate cyclo-ligase [Microcella alkalica]